MEALEEFLPQVNTMSALMENEIHPYYRENDVIPYIQELRTVVQGWYPLGGRSPTAALLGDPVISAITAEHGGSSAQINALDRGERHGWYETSGGREASMISSGASAEKE